MMEMLKIHKNDFLAVGKDLRGALTCSHMLVSEIPIVKKRSRTT